MAILIPAAFATGAILIAYFILIPLGGKNPPIPGEESNDDTN